MSQETTLKIGDTIAYSGGHKGQIEKIRIISSGKFVTQYEYTENGDNVVLTLKDKHSIINLWLKDTPIHKITEKQEKV